MKLFLAGILVMLVANMAVATQSSPVAHESTPPAALDKLPLKPGERVYLVEDGEADINDDLIKRISIGGNEVVASYRNKKSRGAIPAYKLELYNAQGWLLGSTQVRNGLLGNSTYLKPDAVGMKKLHMEWYPLDQITARTSISLQEQWKAARWVVISDSNTLAQDAESR